MENPLDVKRFELKRIDLQRADGKAPMGLTVEEKGPGAIVVMATKAGMPAANSGLKVGDYALAIDGVPIVGREDLERGVAGKSAATLVVARKRSAMMDKPTLPNGKERKSVCDYLILRLRKSADLGIEWSTTDGVVVAKTLTIGAFGHLYGLKAGDHVLCVNEEAVGSQEQFGKLMEAAKGSPVDLLVERPHPGKSSATKPAEQPNAPTPIPSPPAPPAPEAPQAPPSPPTPVQSQESVSAMELGLQSFREQIGDPRFGIEPPPDDVQALADGCREEIVERIKPVKVVKSERKKPALGEAEPRVQIDRDISMIPLKSKSTRKKS